jgi:hypothetical protein
MERRFYNPKYYGKMPLPQEVENFVLPFMTDPRLRPKVSKKRLLLSDLAQAYEACYSSFENIVKFIGALRGLAIAQQVTLDRCTDENQKINWEKLGELLVAIVPEDIEFCHEEALWEDQERSNT